MLIPRPSLIRQSTTPTNVVLFRSTMTRSISTSLATSSSLHPQSSTALHLAYSMTDVSSTVYSAAGPHTTLGILAAYSIFANLLYLARRAHLRQMTMRELWKIRTTREEGVSRLLFGGMIVAWQMLVLVFPIVEPCLRFSSSWMRLCRSSSLLQKPTSLPSVYPKNTEQPGWTIFFYSYPKAQGGGYILEPLACQHLGANQRAKQQIRFDWHSFKYNVGPIGRDGFRHPPAIERNLPHIDIPRYQMRHWPWRKQYKIPNDEGDEEEEQQ